MYTSTFENNIKNPNGVNIKSLNNPSSFMINSDNINVPDSLIHSQVNNMVMIEAKRLVINERINTIRCKREEKFLGIELKKFQNKLYASRPKFNGLTSLVHNNIQKLNLPIYDYNKLFFLDEETYLPKIKFKQLENFHSKKPIIGNTNNNNNNNINSSDTDELTINHHYYHPKQESNDHLEHTNKSISVIIKDKPIVLSLEKNLEIMRFTFNLWHNSVLMIQRLRHIKTKVQQHVMSRKLRRFFNAWKNTITLSKQLTAKNKEKCELDDVKKIEMFVNMMKEKQKMPGKNKTNDNNKQMKNHGSFNDSITMKMMKNNKNIRSNFINVEEPHNHRLKVQKQIITEQKIKLAEQNRLIEDMKLQQIEVESRISRIKTINIAKTVMNMCGSQSHRDYFMAQFIQQNRDEKLSNSSSRTFPKRLEARAVARKEKIRQRQIERERLLYEEKLKKEAKKIEDEKIRKDHQRNVKRKTKRIREEKKWENAENAKKIKVMNELADHFFQKYLLRNYIIKPFILLVQINRSKMLMATKHCNEYRMKKTFVAWRNEVIHQLEIKYKLSIFIYNKNLLCYYFQQWFEFNKNEIRKYQVACDINDLRTQEKYFNIWKEIMIKMQIKNNTNKKIATNFYDRMMKKIHFSRWKKYMIISDRIKESDRRREQWRKLVQLIVPDFSPKYRGVLIDD
ncbi:hypothetical protein PV325_002577 [Microctonus aethiopoides]|uniref:Sfi1 spindle body domain-containing protein n=1 Tax=Microctonus aethiopoides TaxID=144406 RepID=A0AA39FKP4_9HYME|nr:hypothetical protein PV325_002577 [Microctonus aethiopoides]KAK0171375.1 hypothetical protein PV328_009115 [Microctonus aethiopoides]